MSLEKDIKAYALDIGYTHVGIAPADGFCDHINEIESRGDFYDFYSQDPRGFMDGALPQKSQSLGKVHHLPGVGLRPESLPRGAFGKNRPHLPSPLLWTTSPSDQWRALSIDGPVRPKNGLSGCTQYIYT